MRLSIIFLLVVVVSSIAGLAGNAFAQQTSIVTSADEHGSRFFGEGVLQVVVINSDADDNDTIEEISVEIEAEPDMGISSSIDITVPETSDDSGRFEFFLAHADGSIVGPGDLDPLNKVGVEGDGTCLTNCAPFVTFGLGGDLDIAATLYENVRFEIKTGNSKITINYEETRGMIVLDRDSYGTTSYVYVSVVDQDANLNPLDRDEFTVDFNIGPASDLFALDGGSLEDIMTFRETGDNTAVFEGRFKLGESMIATSELLVLTLYEKANYEESLAAPENGSNNTDEISFTVGDSDGTVSIGGGQQAEPTWDASLVADKEMYVVGQSVSVTIMDRDANVDPNAVDFIQLDVSSRRSNIALSATETGANTGVFEASFVLTEMTSAGTIAPSNIVTVTYTDEHPADYSEKVQAGQDPRKDFILEINVQIPVRTGIEATDVTPPLATSISGGDGPYSVGDSITLLTTVLNNNDEFQRFLVIIEVRDINGSGVFLALQGGILEPSGHSDFGALWQPNQSGTFQVRTFVISDFEEGEVLSPIAVSEVTII